LPPTHIVTNPERARKRDRVWVPSAVIGERPPSTKDLAPITTEDEDRLMNVIVKPDVYGRHYKVLRNCFLLIVDARVQRQARSYHPGRGGGGDIGHLG
jgi:hypothetical protein